MYVQAMRAVRLLSTLRDVTTRYMGYAFGQTERLQRHHVDRHPRHERRVCNHLARAQPHPHREFALSRSV